MLKTIRKLYIMIKFPKMAVIFILEAVLLDIFTQKHSIQL